MLEHDQPVGMNLESTRKRMADSTYLMTFSEYLGIRSKPGAMAIHAQYSMRNALDLLTMEKDPNEVMHLLAPNIFYSGHGQVNVRIIFARIYLTS